MSEISKQLVELVIKKGVSLMAYPFSDLEEDGKKILIEWLDGRSFPTGNPTELVGDQYVLAALGGSDSLLIFSLHYDGPEQCAGTIVISFDGKVYSLVEDNVECSD